MLGHKDRGQLELFIAGSLQQLVPEDHVLARVDRVLDLGWLGEEVADCYCADNGRPGIDPEAAVRLMLAGLLLGIVHDRRLMREAQVNIAIRWFIGYGLHERLPDHSSLTRIRQRWGEARFGEIFKRTVTACLDARIATAEVVHIDASLIRANVSWDSLAERHAGKVVTENDGDRETEAKRRSGPSGKVSRTDPDASMATSASTRRHEPCYKQHTAVDDARGVVLGGDDRSGEREQDDRGSGRCGAGDHGARDRDGDCRCRLCLRQGLWRLGTPPDRSGNPNPEGSVTESSPPAPLPLRRQAPPCEVSTWQDPAPGTASRTRPGLPLQGQRLRVLPAQGWLFTGIARQQRGRRPA